MAAKQTAGDLEVLQTTYGDGSLAITLKSVAHGYVVAHMSAESNEKNFANATRLAKAWNALNRSGERAASEIVKSIAQLTLDAFDSQTANAEQSAKDRASAVRFAARKAL